MANSNLINTEIKRSATKKQKSANNAKRAKAIMTKYAMNIAISEKTKERFLRNYGLLNGDVDLEKYNYTLNVKIPNDELKGNKKLEDFNIGYKNMRHHPLIMTIFEDIAGMEREMPLSVSVKSLSPEINNQKLQERDDRLLKNFNRSASVPLINQGLINNLQDNLSLGIIDPGEAELQSSLINSDIETLDIEGIGQQMEEFQIPVEIDGQKLIDFAIEKLNIRKIKSDSLPDILATYRIFLKVGIERGKMVFERWNPVNVSYLPSPHSHDVEKASVIIHKQVVSFQQALAMDGEYFTPDDIKKLESLSKLGSSTGYSGKESMGRPVDNETNDIAYEYAQIGQNIDHYSQEGQNIWMGRLMRYANNENIDIFNANIERRYITWMDYRKWKKVTRIIDGKEEVYYHSENYTENPEIDLEIVNVEFPEPWEGVMYGLNGQDAVFIKVREVQYPVADPNNPWDRVLPVFGGELNTKDGNAKNKTPVDAAAEYNYEYDLFSEIYKKESAVNYGKVLSFINRFKPDKMSWEEFFTVMHNLSISIVDPYKEELIDGRFNEAMNAYKALDLSKNLEIAGIIQRLTYLEQRTYKMMLFNENAAGNIGQYAKASNVIATIKSTQSRLNNLFTKQQEIFQKAFQYLFDAASQFYADNPEKISFVFKSADRMFKNLDWKGMSSLDMGIKIDTNPEEISKVELIKNNLLMILQNSIAKDAIGVMDIADASTMAKLKEIAIGIDQREQKRQEIERNDRLQMQDNAVKADEAKFQRESQLKIELEKMKNEYDLQIAQIEVEKFAKTLDINKDGVNDMNQLQETKNEIELKKLEVEKMKIMGELEIKKKEIESKYQESNKKLIKNNAA